jgi:hypothetical protein
MPLLDLDQLPSRNKRSWAGFHSTWAVCITQDLNAHRLPARYHAEPLTQAGMEVEADVSTFEEDEQPIDTGENGNGGGVATAVWAPPQPPIVAQVDFGNLDIYEVRIYDREGTRALVAAIELVSPANKDRPSERESFATKCAAYLQQSVSLVIVDPVTERRANLHEEIVRRIHLGDEVVQGVTSPLYAVAYRTAGIGTQMRLEVWPAALAIGAPLPTLPLWIAPAVAVPLELETTYNTACASLRIRA